jgi:Histidine kinase-, DNA gyrase B-, and HSP90-like ATPase
VSERMCALRVKKDGTYRATLRSDSTYVPVQAGAVAADRRHVAKPRGMGIGLAICRSIIESHGGQISAGNRHDRSGATFTIHLPHDPR